MKKALYLLTLTLVVIALVIVVSPRRHNSGVARVISGTVNGFYQSGRDVMLTITGLKHTFCIRGGSQLKALREELSGKKVRILYEDSWTPLDPGASKPVAELRLDEQILYSEK